MFSVYKYNIIREEILIIITYDNDCYIKYIIYMLHKYFGILISIIAYWNIFDLPSCVALKCKRLSFCHKNQWANCSDDLVEYFI